MRLADLPARQIPPAPWAEGDNIPWYEPGFSARMLAEHLSQEHDAASRRAETIDRQIAWIHGSLLRGRPTSVLDLGCGPGLYSERLARLGHRCVGIDYSPASIAYARARAAAEGLDCDYRHGDIREAGYGTGFGLALLIYGEFNVFPPEQAARIVAGTYRALTNGGTLVLEPHTFEAVRRMGERSPTWYTATAGLFSATPHLVLREHFWDAVARVATIRYFVVEPADGSVTGHAQSLQAYTTDEYRDLLHAAGFVDVEFHPSLAGDYEANQRDFFAIVARK
ncbi:MAG TPA: class I SAM-dependent methyltransferase [Thermomicrobiaceae bacterium]|nr:class I SAM-dependent methyltransferase [Thermomicrobiaceae bacterium]